MIMLFDKKIIKIVNYRIFIRGFVGTEKRIQHIMEENVYSISTLV